MGNKMKILSIIILGIVIFSNTNNILAQTVKIGTQEWMTENLNVDKFRNGDAIPEAKTAEEWKKAGKEGTPAWCYYDNKPKNGKKYGRLYNWYAVNDKRGLSPAGFHIPTKAEFATLAASVNNNSNALKAKGEGRRSGFSASLAGFCYSGGGFYVGDRPTFWSSTEYITVLAYTMYLEYNNSSIGFTGSNKGFGYSVRCLKD